MLPALLTAAILWIIFYRDGFVPFGVNTPAVTDAKLQYLDLFAFCRDVLTGQNSAGYTFSNTLGGSAAAIWAYYLASPFNLLVLLFPKEQMNLFLEVLITVKLSAASAAFAWFIRRRFSGRIRREIALILSVSYGLMQYMLAQGSNVMWLDGVILLPFIVMGIHRAAGGAARSSAKASERRFHPAELAVPAALSVLANWYTGGINYLFSAVWFLYEELRKEKTRRSRLAADLGRYAAGMGTGLLLAAFLFVPNILLIRAGKGAAWGPSAGAVTGSFRGNPLSIFRSYRIGEQSDMSRVSLFCGSLAMFGTAAFFLSKRVRGREKAAAAALSLIIWMSYFWQPLFYVFSLFMTNTSYWYRYGYLGSFVLLYFAAYWAGSLPESGGFSNAGQWSVIPKAGGLCLALVIVSQRIWPSGGTGTTRIAVFMLLALTVLTGIAFAPKGLRGIPVLGGLLAALYEPEPGEEAPVQPRDLRRAALCGVLVLCLLEEVLQTRAMLRIYHTDTAQEYASYSAQQQAQIREIGEADPDGFYRISQTAARITNIDGLTGAYLDAMAYGYASICGYTSCPENMQLDFLDRIGYRKEYDSFNIVNTSFLPADSLLGVRYVLSPYGIPGLEEEKGFPARNGKSVFKNPYALPAAMLIEEEPAGHEAESPETAEDPFSYTEHLYERILGQKADLWTEVRAEQRYEKGRTEWTLTVPEGEICLYGNLPWKEQVSFADPRWWDEQEQGRLTVSEGWAFGYGGWLSPSVFYIPAADAGSESAIAGTESGRTARVVLETSGDPGLKDAQFYALDLDKLAEASAGIRERSKGVRDLKIENGRISCRVDAREGSKLLLAVPASEGWTARINGQKTQIGAFEACFMEIPLVPGENHITMQYRTPGFGAGILMSLAGFGILAAWSLAGNNRHGTIRGKRTRVHADTERITEKR